MGSVLLRTWQEAGEGGAEAGRDLLTFVSPLPSLLTSGL